MSAIRLFDTATRALQDIEPRNGRLSLYVCGVTPYDTTHLGHAFTFVSFDVLLRYLRDSGVTVTYAQNVTDIDDDILRKAAEVGMSYDELGRRETESYVRDMRALNVTEPDFFVPATTVMSEITRSVGELLEGGFAYASGGNIYFDRHRVPDYGALAHTDQGHLIQLASEHGGFPDDARKRDPLDFLLWQGTRPGEPAWPSPFGPGRPGWHIECSTIARHFLGFPVDIHGGGVDLIFPHHASEAAEAESICGHGPFVRCWMHTAMVRMEGAKMSKSLGNMVLMRDLLREYSADAIRLYLVSHHYRREFEWKEEDLREAAGLASRVRSRVMELEWTGPEGDLVAEMKAAAHSDLNTPRIVDILRALSGTSPGSLTDEEGNALLWGHRVLGLGSLNSVPTAATVAVADPIG